MPTPPAPPTSAASTKPALKSSRPERSALDLIEEAIHLLRSAPLRILLYYSVGTLPFIAGMLYYCMEVRIGRNTWEIVVTGSLVLSVLYVWMAAWHTAFARELWALRLGQPAPVWTPGAAISMAATQARWSPWGLFALPISTVFLVPLPWCYMFMHNISILGTGMAGMAGRGAGDNSGGQGGGPGSGTRADSLGSVALSIRMSSEHMRQSVQILFFCHLLYLLLYINWLLLLLAAHLFLHWLSGIETPLSENPALYFSVPVQLAICGATFFVANPIMRAVCLLRCIYGTSRHTGDDLLAGLRAARARIAVQEAKSRIHSPTLNTPASSLSARASAAAALRSGGASMACMLGPIAAVALGLLAALPSTSHAQGTPEKAPAPASAPSLPAGESASPDFERRSQEIQRSMQRVLKAPEYTWRDPSEVNVQQLADDSYFRWIGKKIQEWLEWFFKRKNKSESSEPSNSSIWDFLNFGRMNFANTLLVIGLLIVALAICVFLLRRKRRRVEPVAAISMPLPPPPVDVADEQVLASALPEDEWRALAERLRGEGNLRLALRALYLGTLAQLARRDFIIIARAKSTRNYRRELQMKARHVPPVLSAFEAQAYDFERIWYGAHPSTAELFDQFLQRQINIDGAAYHA